MGTSGEIHTVGHDDGAAGLRKERDEASGRKPHDGDNDLACILPRLELCLRDNQDRAA